MRLQNTYRWAGFGDEYVCIRFRILALHLGEWRGTTQVILQEEWCFLPQRHNIGIPFIAICYIICRTSFRYCCYQWRYVPTLTPSTVCPSDFRFHAYWSRDSLMSVLILKRFDVLPGVILNFENKVNRLLWKYWNWVAIDMPIGTWLLIRFCGQ